MAHTHPAPFVVAQDEESTSGSSLVFSLPVGGLAVDDFFVLHLLTQWDYPNTWAGSLTGAEIADITDNVTSGWTRRDEHVISGGGGFMLLDEWTAFYDGSMTDVEFSINGTYAPDTDVAIAVIDVIDNHLQGGIASPQFHQASNLQNSFDDRYFIGGTISPHEAVRKISFVCLASSHNEIIDAGGAGSVTGPPPDGWGDFHGLDTDDVQLWVSSKRSDLIQGEPSDWPSHHLGGWVNVGDGPPGGWAWAGLGDPENSETGIGVKPEFAHKEMVFGMLNFWHYHEYFPDEEEEFPYWGLLGAMA